MNHQVTRTSATRRAQRDFGVSQKRLRMNCWRPLHAAIANPAGSIHKKGSFIGNWDLRQATAAHEALLKG